MKKSINMEIVSNVARFVGLEEICLLRSESNLLDEFFQNGKGVKFLIEQACHAEVLDSISKNRFKILVDFKLKTVDPESPEKQRGKKSAFIINASFVLTYSLGADKEFTKDDLCTFANVNGIFNCWPYWREFVQSITTRMGLPPLTIPLFKIPYSPQKKSSKVKREGKG